jgi:hypothetical protein
MECQYVNNIFFISSYMHQHANFFIQVQLIVNLKAGTTNNGLLPKCSRAPCKKLVEQVWQL